MEVIVIESEAFKRIEYMLKRAAQLGKEPDVIYTLEEAANYLRVDKKWIQTRKDKIGFFQEGRVIRIRKSAIDKYFDSLTIKPRIKKMF